METAQFWARILYGACMLLGIAGSLYIIFMILKEELWDRDGRDG